jgi:branched-chain amino acid aminotransferase
MTAVDKKPAPKFGTVFCKQMGMANLKGGEWGEFIVQPTQPIALSPAAHVLHYASSIFEGLKAYRWADGGVRIFRLDRHLERMRQSAEAMCLPFPGVDMLRAAIIKTVKAVHDEIPHLPESLYIRPCLIGTSPDIGAAALPSSDACLFVLLSPVGDYFAGGLRPLRLLVADDIMRTTVQMGRVKTGGNYAAALRLTIQARKEHAVDQVLFCPGGDVQETGAANFMLFDDKRILTKALDPSFLHGVTRDSLLTLARDMGYEVDERAFTVDELLERASSSEAALTGTAAVLSPVGELVYHGKSYKVGSGQVGPNALKFRKALTDIQGGLAEDRHGWVTAV